MRKHPPHLVIGICGRVGAGKTTVAKLVLERFRFRRPNQVCHVCQFSEPLKSMLAVVGVEKGEGPGEVPHPAFRDMAQHLGCWIRNNIDRDFWVNIARDRIEGMNSPTVAILADVRFPNEGEMCDLVVRLTTTRDTGLAGYQQAHESEKGWEMMRADLTFANDQPGDAELIADAVYAKAVEMMENE